MPSLELIAFAIETLDDLASSDNTLRIAKSTSSKVVITIINRWDYSKFYEFRKNKLIHAVSRYCVQTSSFFTDSVVVSPLVTE